MPALKMLDLSGNELSGTLPVDWSGANNLIMLLLSNNSFSGRALTALPCKVMMHVPHTCKAAGGVLATCTGLSPSHWPDQVRAP